ncbi:MAG: fibronectin type III domain-containing protein [Propionibacteriales bacterium]|nr:fibronectin type III domain-containing protein [Propionibacteriales bacterium]
MLAVVLLAAGGGLAPPAGAANGLTLVADPLQTWQVSGKVWALASAPGVVYVGGTFDSVRPPEAPAGTGEVPRANFAAIDASTGEPLPCAPAFTVTAGVTPSIEGMETSPDGSTLYVGGRFSSVNGKPAGNFAAIDTATCTVRTGFPSFNGSVRAFAPTATSVYVGGSFTKAGGQTRTRLAKLSSTGQLQTWAPSADNAVQALTIAPVAAPSRVYAGGDFLTVNGQSIQAIVALDTTSGEVVQTFPGWITDKSRVKALANDGQNFYLAAEGTGAGQFDGRIAANLATGAMLWRDGCTGATQDIEPVGKILYSASHAHDCSHNPDGFPNYAMDGRQHLLAEKIADRTILPWFPDTNEGVNNVGVGPYALVFAAGQLWVGGEFTTVNKSPQQGLTRFPASPDTGAPPIVQPTGTSTTTGVATVSWPASWDRDDGLLTYALYRDDATTPIYQKQVDSRFWLRPTIAFDDTNVASGSTHSYRVTVSDGLNTSRKSSATVVTVL